MRKVEKIKAEIERLKNELSDNKERLSLREIIAVNNCYNNLLLFIDSLEEEPVNNDFEEAACEYDNSHIDDNNLAFKAGAEWQKERMLNNAIEREVKEIDLEKEIEKEWLNCDLCRDNTILEYANMDIKKFRTIAKHFFELGLKAKGE